MVIIVMGVSGSGKTTVGRALADSLGWDFSDADDFHSPGNVNKMKSGLALTDQDRGPWLRDIRSAIERWTHDEQGHVLACSALKESYRDILGRDDPEVRFVFLKGSIELISQRLQERKGHFFNASLLRSQFDALEAPRGALVVDIAGEPEEIVRTIIEKIKPVTSRLSGS